MARACFGVALVVFAGCGGSDDPKVGDGVDDLVTACQIRATWNRTGNDCSVCEQAVITPRCDCSELKDFSAACSDQQDARGTVCAASVDTCVNACSRTDCTCIAACYANDAACKKATDARDGCITQACASHCK